MLDLRYEVLKQQIYIRSFLEVVWEKKNWNEVNKLDNDNNNSMFLH